MEAAGSMASKVQALEDLDADVHAKGSIATRRSLLNTWVKFHLEWFGPEEPVLPLTEAKVRAVAAMFKKGRYRSFGQYASRIKEEHAKEGYDWNINLDITRKQCDRSVTRGIGPARQSAGYSVEDVFNLPGDGEPLVEDGPMGSKNMLIVGAFFMLREAEIAAMRMEHLTCVEEKKVINIELSVSKTDVKALGVHRAWGCLCGGSGNRACPWCSLSKQVELLKGRFGDRSDLRGLPVLPTRDA